MNNQLTGMAVIDAAIVAGPAAAEVALSVPGGQTLRLDDERLSDRARKLIAIGETAIARHDDQALDAFFAADFVFHGPTGEATYPQLKAAFADFRASFQDFRVTRQAIIENGQFVSARTTMSGLFTHAFDTPFGTIAPTGKQAEWELINIFRYDADGHLAEEWVQYDYAGFMRELGVTLVPSGTA